MDIFRHIQDVRNHLKLTFDNVDGWFEKDKKTLNHQPLNGGWTIQKILEHIYLTNFYLLILIEKGSKKAIKNSLHLDLESEIKNYSFNKEKFNKVGEHGAFEWVRPDHMQPKGELSPDEIRSLIRQQYLQCLHCLEIMKNGEGLLYTTTMTVNGLGKINVYEYIYFLSLHAQRHITQMKKNESETIKN
ncbi:DinB family protein [Chryseobacterium sp.]|uniref:DinB family protein n=1 Tax=Chryseobacterium sp. TaxID=1871047 RepID=UPI001B022B88|nr:DinB family protein [Chryseobacterium sp.]MBO9693892.1 DinB family protein [Chryseobacterium sp.]